ncbi:sensor histidine kinase, partial [Methylobacterium sp. E-041]|nr:sensor histidine kinase [Methylobacterium sp. E-041]
MRRGARRLVATRGGAFRFGGATLASGGAAGRTPRSRAFALAPVLAELADLAALSAHGRVRVVTEVAPEL